MVDQNVAVPSALVRVRRALAATALAVTALAVTALVVTVLATTAAAWGAEPGGLPGGWVATSGDGNPALPVVVESVADGTTRRPPLVERLGMAPSPLPGAVALFPSVPVDRAVRLAWSWPVASGASWTGRWVLWSLPLRDCAPVDLSRPANLVLWLRPGRIDGTSLRLALRDAQDQEGPSVLIEQVALGQFDPGAWTPVVLPLAEACAGIDRTRLVNVAVYAAGQLEAGQPASWDVAGLVASDQEPVPGLFAPGWLDLGDSVVLTWRLNRPVDRVRLQADGASIDVRGTDCYGELPRSAIDDGGIRLLPVTRGERGPQLRIAIPPKVGQTEPATVRLAGNPRKEPVSRWLFGANGYRETYDPTWSREQAEGGITITRWGGNLSSTYNWQDDADNSGKDWFFVNRAYGSHPPASVQDTFWWRFVRDHRRERIDQLFTVPIGDWVARRPVSPGTLGSFPRERLPQQRAFDPNWGRFGDGFSPEGTPLDSPDPSPAYRANTPEFQAEWLRTAVREFGTAEAGGIRLVGLDNEVGLWHETHRDIAPAGCSSVELVRRNRDYAQALKAVDPTVQIVGLASWGAKDLAGSDLDFSPPGKPGLVNRDRFPDPAQAWSERREVRNGQDQFRWYLDRMREAEQEAGRRLIDAVGIAWYPQVVYEVGGKLVRVAEIDQPYDGPGGITELQFDALRHWYDPVYDSPKSWMREGPYNTRDFWTPFNPVIPRLTQAIAEHYPGTRIAFTEWSTGSESQPAGALLHVEMLGILMEGEVWLSTHWRGTRTGDWAYWGHALLGNWDGQRTTIEGQWLPVATEGASFTAFATIDPAHHRRHVVLVNRNHEHPRLVDLPAHGAATWRISYLSETAGKRIVRSPERPVVGGRLQVALPPFSAAVVVLDDQPGQ